MSPLPMNEFIQQNLADVGHQGRVRRGRLEPDDQHLARRRARPGLEGRQTRSTSATSSRIRSPAWSGILQLRPQGAEGHQLGPLLRPGDGQAYRRGEEHLRFEGGRRRWLQKVHEKYVDDALFLIGGRTTSNARGHQPGRLKGFVQAKKLVPRISHQSRWTSNPDSRGPPREGRLHAHRHEEVFWGCSSTCSSESSM